MADIKAVGKPAEDPKAGKPRSTSGTKFPYYDLENAVAVAKAIYEQAGGQCDQVQLAALDLPPRVVPHPMLVPAPVESREGRASSGTRATA